VKSNANPNLSATKIWQNSFKGNFTDNRSCLSVHIMDHKKKKKSMPSYHLHTSNDDQEIYTGEHVELTVAQGASTETA
jgi:hypothetical protein